MILARPPGGNADRPRQKGSLEGIVSLRLPITAALVLPALPQPTSRTHKEEIQPGWWTSRIRSGGSVPQDIILPKCGIVSSSARKSYSTVMKFAEYSGSSMQQSASKQSSGSRIENAVQGKVIRTKIKGGDQALEVEVARNQNGREVPAANKKIKARRLQAKTNATKKAGSNEIPDLIGNELEKDCFRMQRENRSELGYLPSTMSSGMTPLAKHLGFRPQSAYRGFQQLISDQYEIKTDGSDQKVGGDQKVDFLIPAVGPASMTFVFSSDPSDCEREWWVRPHLLGCMNPSTLRLFPQHLMSCDLWDRAVMMLCNLAFLVEKILVCGVSAVHKDLQFACDGLKSRCDMFLDVESWQYSHQKWYGQIQEYKALIEANQHLLEDDPTAVFVAALQVNGRNQFCLQDAEHAVNVLKNAILDSEKRLSDGISNLQDAISVFECLEIITIAQRHGVDRIWQGNPLEPTIASITEALQNWKIERAENEDCVDEAEVYSGHRRPLKARAMKIKGRNEPKWYHDRKTRSASSLKYSQAMTVLNFSRDMIGYDRRRFDSGLLKGRSVRLFVSVEDSDSGERDFLFSHVLPALRVWAWKQAIEFAWTASSTSSRKQGHNSNENAVLHSLDSIDQSTTAAGRCFMLCLRRSKACRTSTEIDQETDQVRDHTKEITESSKTSKQIRRFKAGLRERFSTIFDAWAYFDEFGDGKVGFQKFCESESHLRIKDIQSVVLFQSLSAEQNLESHILPQKFVELLTWHFVSKDGSASFMNKCIHHSILCRKQIVRELQERMANLLLDVDDLQTKADAVFRKDQMAQSVQETPIASFIGEVSKIESFRWIDNDEFRSRSLSNIEFEHGFVRRTQTETLLLVKVSNHDEVNLVDLAAEIQGTGVDKQKKVPFDTYCLETQGWQLFATKAFKLVVESILRQLEIPVEPPIVVVDGAENASDLVVPVSNSKIWSALPSVVTWGSIHSFRSTQSTMTGANAERQTPQPSLEYQAVSNEYIRDLTILASARDVASWLPASLEDLYEYCIIPWLEVLHGRKTIQEIASVLVQSSFGATQEDIRALISPRTEVMMISTAQLSPIVRRLRRYLFPISLDERLLVASQTLKQAFVVRYNLHRLNLQNYDVGGHKSGNVHQVMNAGMAETEEKAERLKATNTSQGDQRAVAESMHRIIILAVQQRFDRLERFALRPPA